GEVTNSCKALFHTARIIASALSHIRLAATAAIDVFAKELDDVPGLHTACHSGLRRSCDKWQLVTTCGCQNDDCVLVLHAVTQVGGERAQVTGSNTLWQIQGQDLKAIDVLSLGVKLRRLGLQLSLVQLGYFLFSLLELV